MKDILEYSGIAIGILVSVITIAKSIKSLIETRNMFYKDFINNRKNIIIKNKNNEYN